MKIIMDCRTPELCEFKKKLGFNLHDGISTKEQTVLNSIKDAFEEENMQTQYKAIGMFFTFINTNLQLKLMY